MTQESIELHIGRSPSARVDEQADGTWHLEIPYVAGGGYRLAQLDNNKHHHRAEFTARPPLKLSLQARVSAQDIPGTWGFGLWNDPFSVYMGLGGMAQRLPALPDAAWFFHASLQNYLSFRDDLPAQGFLAATFASRKVPAARLVLASPILALTLLPGTAQAVRRLLRRFIQQDAAQIHLDETLWHRYTLSWEGRGASFSVDGADVLQTTIAPDGPLSLIIWIDNQYAALPPKGRLKFGTLPNPRPAWLEVRELSLEQTL